MAGGGAWPLCRAAVGAPRVGNGAGLPLGPGHSALEQGRPATLGSAHGRFGAGLGLGRARVGDGRGRAEGLVRAGLGSGQGSVWARRSVAGKVGSSGRGCGEGWRRQEAGWGRRGGDGRRGEGRRMGPVCRQAPASAPERRRMARLARERGSTPAVASGQGRRGGPWRSGGGVRPNAGGDAEPVIGAGDGAGRRGRGRDRAPRRRTDWCRQRRAAGPRRSHCWCGHQQQCLYAARRASGPALRVRRAGDPMVTPCEHHERDDDRHWSQQAGRDVNVSGSGVAGSHLVRQHVTGLRRRPGWWAAPGGPADRRRAGAGREPPRRWIGLPWVGGARPAGLGRCREQVDLNRRKRDSRLQPRARRGRRARRGPARFRGPGGWAVPCSGPPPSGTGPRRFAPSSAHPPFPPHDDLRLRDRGTRRSAWLWCPRGDSHPRPGAEAPPPSTWSPTIPSSTPISRASSLPASTAVVTSSSGTP